MHMLKESSNNQSTSEKGTMGYGYQQYIKKHPNQKVMQHKIVQHSQQNLEQLSPIMAKEF